MRCITLVFLIFTLSLLMEKNVFSQEKTRIGKVVIDAGHGGKDPGTIGKKSQEKNIALQIALKLTDEIRSQCKDVTVICTRTTDEFIELHERAEIANRSKADLFISIHCNANPKHDFHGAETYVMGLHRTEANLEIAKKENAAILMEPDYSANYNGFDPNSDESYITFTLFQNAFLEQSTWFASIVQDEMKDRVGMFDRGVRQAGFLVLYKTTMPSVLIETGFLSNPEEEKFLNSQKGQLYISSAICRAFRQFKAKMEGNSKELASLNEKKSSPANSIVIPPEEKKVNPPEEKPKQAILTKDTARPKEKTKGNPSQTVTEKPKEKPKSNPSQNISEKPKEKPKGNPSQNISEKPKEPLHRNDTVKVGEKLKVSPKVTPTGKSADKTNTKPLQNHPVKDTLKAESKEKNHPVKKDSVIQREILVTNRTKPGLEKEKPAVKPTAKTEEIKRPPAVAVDEVVFRVQIATSPKELSTHSKKFAGLPEVWRYQHQGLYKFTAGKETSPEALAGLVKEAKKMGFTDAFIVAFHGTERITVAEAKKLISDKK